MPMRQRVGEAIAGCTPFPPETVRYGHAVCVARLMLAMDRYTVQGHFLLQQDRDFVPFEKHLGLRLL